MSSHTQHTTHNTQLSTLNSQLSTPNTQHTPPKRLAPLFLSTTYTISTLFKMQSVVASAPFGLPTIQTNFRLPQDDDDDPLDEMLNLHLEACLNKKQLRLVMASFNKLSKKKVFPLSDKTIINRKMKKSFI